MSVLAVSDRTQETAQNIGASTPITLLGAAGIGLQAFPARLDGELVPYTIEHETSGQWEVGEGVYNHSAKTLARTIVYDNSNGNTSPVNFANGIVDVWIDLPAEKAVMLDADSSNLTVPGNLTMQAGATMALAGATVSGAPTWSAGQAITLTTALQPNVTTMSALVSVGTLTTGVWNATPVTTPYGGTGLTTYAAGDTLYYVSGTTLARRAIGAANTVSLSNGTNPTWAANLPYATLPTGNGTWDNGSGNTVTFAQNVTVSGTLTASGTFIGSAAAGSLTGTTLAANVVNSSLTNFGVLAANLLFVDNAYTIGTVGANRPSAIFVANSGTFGGGLNTVGAVQLDTGATGSSFGGALTVNGRLVSSGTFTAASATSVQGNLTTTGGAGKGLDVVPTIIASANNDAIIMARVLGSVTPGAFTGISFISLQINGVNVSTWSSPADPIELSFGNINGGGLTTNAYQIKFGTTSGATNNYVMQHANFNVQQSGLGTFTGVTVSSGSTLTLTGAMVAGAPTWSAAQTFPSGTQVSSASGAAFLINGAAGQTRDLQFESGGSLRWIFRTNATAESGGNAGSDFNLIARDDTGAQIDAPISILRVAGGVMTLVRPLRVSNTIGVNTAPTTTVGINMISTLTGGTTQSGILSTATIDSTGTSIGRGIYSKVATAAAAFTLTNAYGIHIDSGAAGVGSTITNLYGLKIENQTAGASNFALWVGSGQSRFNDAVVFQGSMSLNALNVTASITASSASTRAIFIDPTHIAAANNDSLNGIVVSNLYTPGTFTGLNTVGIRIDGWNISGFTSPGDPVMFGVGHLTQLNGTGATNAYAIKMGAGPTGATNNYLIHATNFNLTSAGLLTSTGLQSSGAVLSSSATAGSGYSTGAGGAVTQLTSRTTGVTLSKPCGAITLFTAAGTTAFTTFTVTNTLVAATDVVELVVKSGTNTYLAYVSAVGSGSFNVTFNTTGGTASDAPVFNFAIFKAVTS